MSNEVEYVVKKPFKYGDKQYNQGDKWTPTGGKWDEQIISTGKVTVEHKAVKRGR